MRVSKIIMLLALAVACGCSPRVATDHAEKARVDSGRPPSSPTLVETPQSEAIEDAIYAQNRPAGKELAKRETQLAAVPSAMRPELDRSKKAGSKRQLESKDFDANYLPGLNASQEEIAGQGEGPGIGGDKFAYVELNPFHTTIDEPLSTFSIDVDTASYSKVRSYLIDHNQLPPPGAVRIEELVNYFTYDYPGPTDQHPFAAHVESATSPWNSNHRLVRIGIKGKEIENEDRPASNLVFLLDVSGSMNDARKLPLL
ncbi:MAG: von Willebrand factor type A domain-containing protein, partial [Blastopirellula sp. JB062]